MAAEALDSDLHVRESAICPAPGLIALGKGMQKAGRDVLLLLWGSSEESVLFSKNAVRAWLQLIQPQPRLMVSGHQLFPINITSQLDFFFFQKKKKMPRMA